MIQRMSNSVMELNEWKPCTFERDGAGNIIWRLPKEVRCSEGIFILENIGNYTGRFYRHKYDINNARVIVIEDFKSRFSKTCDLRGAYRISNFNPEMEIINKLHNIN